MRKKRFLLLLFLTLSFGAKAFISVPPHDRKITLKLTNVSMEVFLDAMKKQTELNFLYNAETFRGVPYISVEVKNEKWNSVLNKVLASRGYEYVVKNDIVVIRLKQKTDNGYVRGVVLDDRGEPLIGSTIIVKRRNDRDLYAITNSEGTFSFIAGGNEESISASYIGYEKEILKFKTGKFDYKFQLRSDNQLTEVVVTGIFNKPKVSFTGAATIISKEEIKASGNRNLLQTISHIDPSFDVQEQNATGSNPNASLNIEIRGTASIGSVQELQTNVRNVRNLPLFILDGFEVTSERVMDMNQADVESVVILKDASATAIYGSRGSNGVVVITSVKPETGKLRVSYTAGLNLEIPDLSSYNLMNSFEKLELEKIADLYTSTDFTTQLKLNELYNDNLTSANAGVNTDWIHKPVQTGVGQYHKIDIGGGNDQFRYILNMSYHQLTGAMKGSKRDNVNGGMTISYLLKKVRFTNNLNLGINKGESSPYGLFAKYVTMNPYLRPYDDNGEPFVSYTTFGSSLLYNPLYDAAQTSFSTNDYTNIRNTTMLDLDIMKDLRLNLSIGFTNQKGGTDQFTSPKQSSYLQLNAEATSAGSYYQKRDEQSSYQFSLTTSYAKILGEHSLFFGVNGQLMETQTNSTIVQVRGFVNDQMTDISNGISYYGEKPSTTESTVRSVGLTGTFNYNYAGRYFFDASYRVDGASSFGSLSRYAPFYSLGLGWAFGSEKFVKKIFPFINSGKFRYSYGVTGSLSFEPYQALTTYEYNTTSQYTGLIGASILGYGNPNLKWQNTIQHNWGIDLSLFNNRLMINANFYRKSTDNLLTDSYLSLSHGYSSYKENIGLIRNTGYDMQASVLVLKAMNNTLNLYLRGGLSHNKNVLVKLSDAIKRANELYSGQNYSGGTISEYREGHSVDDLYVLQSPGVDPQSGEVLYLNDDGTVTTSHADLKKISVGSSQPKINGRIGSSLHWRGLNLDFIFGFRLGAKKLNLTLLNVENSVAKNNSDRRVLVTRWQKPGDITGFKSIKSTDSTNPNNRFVFTEKTLTLSNVNLSYDFPRNWIKRFNMERLSFVTSMSDLFYWSNIEMQRGTDYPYSIKPTFSLTCTF